MEAILIFSILCLTVTIVARRLMQEEVTEGSTCQAEKNDVKTNWIWYYIFLSISIIGTIVGLVGMFI